MSQKADIGLIRDTVKTRGIFLKSLIYIDNKTPMIWGCSNGHEWESIWTNIRRGSGCPFCARQKIDLSDLNQYATNKGGKVDLSNYKNNKSKLNWECSKGHIWSANWANIQSGKWCPICANNKVKTINSLSEFAKKKKAKLLSIEYKNAHIPVEWECEKGHKFKASWVNVKCDKWCSICANSGRSKVQSEIIEFIKSLDNHVEEKARILGKKEVDVYVPHKNLAIEYCGLFWHTENSPEPRTRLYHLSKQKECENKDIRLITIFSDEWNFHKEQVKGFLRTILKSYDNKVFARNCEVKNIDLDTAKTFLEENHIQGYSSSFIAFGLFKEDLLLGVMTAGKHHRNGKDCVLNRFAIKVGWHVPGGASKLFKKLINHARSSGVDKIVSWSDNRWSQGNVYSKLGFVLEADLPPDYSYVNLKKAIKRISKQACTKRSLASKGGIGNTELEMAKSLGLSRIWDCGKKRWIYKIN